MKSFDNEFKTLDTFEELKVNVGPMSLQSTFCHSFAVCGNSIPTLFQMNLFSKFDKAKISQETFFNLYIYTLVFKKR